MLIISARNTLLRVIFLSLFTESTITTINDNHTLCIISYILILAFSIICMKNSFSLLSSPDTSKKEHVLLFSSLIIFFSLEVVLTGLE